MLKKLSPKQKFLLLSILGLALAGLLLGGSILNLVHNKLETRRLIKKRDLLDAQYQSLLEEKKLLEAKDPKYIEEIARLQYHLVKPGEIEFRFDSHD